MRILTTFLGCIFLSGCGTNLYSLPYYTSVPVHNREALEFLKSSGPENVGDSGDSLKVKDPYLDNRIVLLTVSGGGMRASAFTLGVLSELDSVYASDLESTSDLGRSSSETAFDLIDVISSNSGGSWAISAVLSDLSQNRDARLPQRMGDIVGRFKTMSDVKVKHWANDFIPNVTNNLTFGSVYSRYYSRPLPFAYFNASLYPSQSPFVFTPNYLRHYEVVTLGDPASPSRIKLSDYDLESIPIGYAASASGAVPGYTSAFAETRLCESIDASFCAAGKSASKYRRDNLQLMDGGLYDNIGYKTALEYGLRNRARIAQLPATVVMIDSSDTNDFQTLPKNSRADGHLIGIAKASSFPNQNATFSRLRDPAFEAAGFDRRILLNFAAAETSSGDFERNIEWWSGLEDLLYYAAHDVACYDSTGKFLKGKRKLKEPETTGKVEDNLDRLQSKGPDCIRLNFARAGYLYKTTFKYDPYAFKLRYQLGRFVVRLKREQIRQAIFRQQRERISPITSVAR